MTSLGAAIQTVGRAVGSFHPAAMPRFARRHYRREVVAWFFLSVMMGAVEGGIVGVIAKNVFAATVPTAWLNIAVAILSGAPALANVSSFLWASVSHGRNKIRLIVALQCVAALLVAQVALAPPDARGLLMLTIGAVGARVCWAGVVTLRATVWRANYPREVRARMAGKLTTVQAIMLASTGLAVGLALQSNERTFHLIYPIAAGFGLVGAVAYGRMRMRGHAALLVNERRGRDHEPRIAGPFALLRILRNDGPFRRYMVWMFIFGIGNLMISAPLVIMLRDVFGFGYLGGILIMATVPTAIMPLTIPLWSRLLDRVHIVRFRVFHSWSFVATNAAVLGAAIAHEPAWLWVAAACKGVAFGGGVLGWNLGHHDFAPPELTSQYMGVHVTLTGIRGLIGPPLAVAIYALFDAAHAGAGGLVFAVCLVLNLVGAFGFMHMNHAMSGNTD